MFRIAHWPSYLLRVLGALVLVIGVLVVDSLLVASSGLAVIIVAFFIERQVTKSRREQESRFKPEPRSKH